MKRIHVEGIGHFYIPSEPEARAIDSEKTVRGICGRLDPLKAWQERAWGPRVGQEYSYLNRTHIEDVRTIVDVGCNVGSYFVWACRYWWPDTVETVHAYDPGETAISCAVKNRGLVQLDLNVYIQNLAVTIDPAPMFRECIRTGCSHTDGINTRAVEEPALIPVRAKAIHPRDLPPCDAFKCDAEGVEGEIVEHYPHWDGVKVLQMEWHSHADREAIHAMAKRVGLVLRKDDCGASEQGVACWVRP